MEKKEVISIIRAFNTTDDADELWPSPMEAIVLVGRVFQMDVHLVGLLHLSPRITHRHKQIIFGTAGLQEGFPPVCYGP